MNPARFSQMMKYLTRAKKQKPDLPNVFPASQAPIPEKTLTRNMFKEAQERFKNAKAGGGMLVQPGFGGTRQGYAGSKGYVKPLSPELQKLFNKTNPGEEWGKGKFADERARGNWKNDAPRKQKILNATSNLITEDDLSKILTEELGEEITRAKIFGKYGVGQRTKFAETIDNLLFKGKFGSIKGGKDAGGSVRYFKKPSQNDIKKILKSGTLGDVRINTLKTNTVKNVLKLNKKYADIYKAGEIPDIELVMKATGMTEQSAGTATARLAQIYNGHKFNNKNLKGIRVNKKTASKMFEIMDKSPFGNPYRNSLYKVSLATIDEKLGNEIGTFEGLKKKATKILKDNKIPIYDFKKGDKAFGFNINEIAGVTGSAKSKAAEFSQFIDVMEGNLNQKTLANFQGQLSIARQNIENNPDMLSSESKRINKLARSLEGQYDVELPRLRDPDATKYFSPTRIRELNAQGIDVVKAAERAGYTVQMPKGAVTAKEFVSNKKVQTQILNNLVANSKLDKCIINRKADGGRIGFALSDECIRDGLNETKKKAMTGDKKAARQLVKTAKVATRAGLLKNILGPGAILGEAVFEGAIIGNKVLGGKPADIAYAESYLSYLDPRKYRGELDPLKMAREDMLTREVEDAEGNIKTIAAPGSSILKSGFEAQDQLSAFNKAIEDRDDAKTASRIDLYNPAAADAREQGARADQSANIISSDSFKDASRAAQEYLQGQTGANMAKYRTDDFGRFESGRDRDLRRRRMQEMSNIMPRDFLTEKTSDLLDRTQQLKELGYDVSTRDLMAQQDAIKAMPLSLAARMYSPEQVYGTQGEFAGGGIAKLAGVDSGPPPESGPNSQGLLSLKNRVRNY
jgi:hypothetical protein